MSSRISYLLQTLQEDMSNANDDPCSDCYTPWHKVGLNNEQEMEHPLVSQRRVLPKKLNTPKKHLKDLYFFKKNCRKPSNHPTIQPSNHPTIQPSPASASGGSLPVGRQPESEPGLSQAGDQPAWLSWKGREFCVTLGGLNHICICIYIYKI